MLSEQLYFIPRETEVIQAEKDPGGVEVIVAPKEILETKDHQEKL